MVFRQRKPKLRHSAGGDRGYGDPLPGASNAIFLDKIQWFDFDDLVAAFDAARAANSSITTDLETIRNPAGAGAYRWQRYGGLWRRLGLLACAAGRPGGIDLISAQDALAETSFDTVALDLLEPLALVGVPLLV